jgi:hypothetical protein
MHQLGGVTKAPRLDKEAFTAKLRNMLDEVKTAQATSKKKTLTEETRGILHSEETERASAVSRLLGLKGRSA